MITVTIIAALVLIGATMLSTNEMDATRDGAFDVVDVMRRARYVAARDNRAVVVQVLEHGTVRADGGGTTRGLVRAFQGADTTCPQTVAPGDAAFAEADFGELTTDPGAGVARVEPTETGLEGDAATSGFCIRPNGRIVRNSDGTPVPGVDVDDMAGDATVWVQWAPVREVSGELAVPVMEVSVPFNGLVRVPQRRNP